MHSNFFTGQSLVFYNGPVSGTDCWYILACTSTGALLGSVLTRRNHQILKRWNPEGSNRGVRKSHQRSSESRLKDIAKNKYHRKELSSQRTSMHTVLSLFWYTASRQVYRQPNPKIRKKVTNEDPCLAS
jgi:hypothetical protein